MLLAAAIIGFLLLDEDEDQAATEDQTSDDQTTDDQTTDDQTTDDQTAGDQAAGDQAGADQTGADQTGADAADGVDAGAGDGAGTAVATQGTPDEDPAAPPAEEQGRVAVVGGGDVWAMATDGEGLVNVTQGAHPGASQPAWRPGQDQLVIRTDDGLVLVDLAGADPRQLTDDGDHSDPAWDPSGEQIVFSTPAGEGVRDLAILPLNGEPQPLDLPAALGEGTVAQRPTWSPDGTAIVFHVAGPDGLSLWRTDPAGGEAVPVDGVIEGDAFHPAHTADGDLVYSGDQPTRRVYLLETADATSRVVAEVDGADAKDADPSPCGDWIAYQVDGEQTSRVEIVPLDPESAGAPAEELPMPNGVSSITDPAWAGQACPA